MRVRRWALVALSGLIATSAASCWGQTDGDQGAGSTHGANDAASGNGGHGAAGAGGSAPLDAPSDSDATLDGVATDAAEGEDGHMPDGSNACTWGQCTKRWCGSAILHCGDCFENDGDGLLDSEDPDCLGPCDHSEDSWARSPGEGIYVADCYFDGNTEWADDQCTWSHKCDPWADTYPPFTLDDPIGPDGTIYGTTFTCDELFASQSDVCANTCGPLVPNGCDCFGCCEVPQAPTPIWLGSDYFKPCTKETAADPTRCYPCTIVPSCFNPCETCELCLAKTTLPPECGSSQKCPAGVQACGLPGQPCCPDGTYCITGCCQPVPPKQSP